MPSRKDILRFQQAVKDYFSTHGRQLPWRISDADGSFDAYKILVSEIMLQQTQVPRVIPKYQDFLKQFPTVRSLADASLAEVLTVWSGLGYNRRAKYLRDAARQLVSKVPPWKYKNLVELKGIGPNTAAAVCVYTYNEPLIFIETNIRTVFIHHFFPNRTDVSDKDIIPLLSLALSGQEPRSFYWALMDYGSYLKASSGNAARRSKHYVRQSAFAGSNRQLRGQIIRLLAARPYRRRDLLSALADERAQAVIAELTKEEMITNSGTVYRLK